MLNTDFTTDTTNLLIMIRSKYETVKKAEKSSGISPMIKLSRKPLPQHSGSLPHVKRRDIPALGVLDRQSELPRHNSLPQPNSRLSFAGKWLLLQHHTYTEMEYPDHLPPDQGAGERYQGPRSTAIVCGPLWSYLKLFGCPVTSVGAVYNLYPSHHHHLARGKLEAVSLLSQYGRLEGRSGY